VTTPDPDLVSFSFGPLPEDPKKSYFTITNTATNATLEVYDISYSPPPGIIITLTPSEKNFKLEGLEHRTIYLTINVDPDETPEKEDSPYSCRITVDSNAGEKSVDLKVTVKYNAKINVPRSIDFEPVPSKESDVSKVEIREEYGYKTLEGLTISPNRDRNENEWVKPSLEKDTVSKDYPAYVTFTLRPGDPDYERHDNEYTWEFIIRSSSSNVEPVTITVKAAVMRPPKLGKLDDAKLEIKFEEPKGTVLEYDKYIYVPVRNRGDEPMYFSSSVSKSPSGGIVIIKPFSGLVSKRGSDEKMKVRIIAPYNAPEDTYYGELHIYAKDREGKPVGDDDVKITIVIIWPVGFTISSTSPYFTPSPLSIDFGSLALKEQGYEKKSVNITLTERYGYKPVRNLRLSTRDEYGKWLRDNKYFSEIPPGKSRSFTLKIEPGLEAVPKTYSWKYDISASEISRKRLEIKAKIVPMNIPEMIEYLNAFRESILYKSYPSSEVIISNGVGMLGVVDESEIGADDWRKIPVLMKGTLSLLSSLNDGITFSEEENYGKAVENLLSASVSTSTIGSNSELNNWDISGYAKDISTGADKTTEDVLIDEAKKLEVRGWEIKRAIDYATANIILFSIDIEFEEDLNKGVIPGKLKSEFKNTGFSLSDNATVTKEKGEWKITDEKKFSIRKEEGKLNVYRELKEEENVLESALSYQYAATIYGLLNDKEKRIECNYEESLLMDKHDELVSDATDLRIKAEKNIMNTEENDLIRIGDIDHLLNPYKYDTSSESYGSAEKYLEDASTKYKVAGESLMSEDTEKKLNDVKREWSYILSLFLFACILYGAAFFYTITRVITGTMAYMRDMYEREVGDIIVK
jgi:hypothetical protein